MKVTLDKNLCKNTGKCFQIENRFFEQAEVESSEEIISKSIDPCHLDTVENLVKVCPNKAISIDDEGLFEFPDVGP